MQLSNEWLDNRSYTCLPTQFGPLGPEVLLPAGVTDMREAFRQARMVKTGALVQENGDVLFRMIARGAKSVHVIIKPEQLRVDLADQGDGIWEGVFPFRFAGPKATDWFVDDVYVLHPYAPIYYSYSHPVNFVDIPDPEMDYVLVRGVPHGTVCHEYYFSKATGNTESCLVYTPPGYEQGGEYPILYLQHGAGEGETSWIWNGKANFILDNLLAAGKCRPFIVVMNNGMVRGKNDGGPMTMKFDTFTQMLLEDCLPFIEDKYRVIGDKWHRAMAGLSMGSMQTSIIGMTHPELFGYLGLFSGFMRAMGGDESFEAQPHLKCLLDLEKFQADYQLFFRAMGEEDAYRSTFDQDDAFCARLGADPAHLPNHVRKLYPGVHDWNVWRRCLHDFAQMIF